MTTFKLFLVGTIMALVAHAILPSLPGNVEVKSGCGQSAECETVERVEVN